MNGNRRDVAGSAPSSRAPPPANTCSEPDGGLKMPCRTRFSPLIQSAVPFVRPAGRPQIDVLHVSVVQKLHIASRYNTIRATEDASGDVYQCNMHADLVQNPGRACFRTGLVDEILQYQQSLSDRLRIEQQHGDN